MCEFCLKHGEGKKWYLQAKNYSEDLLNDISRQDYIKKFFNRPAELNAGMRYMRKLEKLPVLVRDTMKRLVTRRMKKVHFGQVLPLEDVEKILEFTNSVVRVACICRHAQGQKDKRYCYGLSLGPNGGKFAELLGGLDQSFVNGPDSAGLERLKPQEALKLLRAHESEAMCHTIWTFQTPFIAGICNCDRQGCLGLRCTLEHSTPLLFKAEYLAEVAVENCSGCGLCTPMCQFEAIRLDAKTKKAGIDQTRCFGCGVCRNACQRNAITLKPRSAIAAF